MKRSKIEAELQRETAYSRFNENSYGAMDNLDRTRTFHEAMGMTVRDEPGIPSVSERILRARLLLEETLETIEKGLGVRIAMKDLTGMLHWGFANKLEIIHIEGEKYDPIETLDGLADVKVVANGTAVQFGLPLREGDYEVYCSNMTKLDESGKPIVNRCVREGHIHEGRSYDLSPDCKLLDESKPLGKVLKPDCYVPANIVRIFEEFAGDGDKVANRLWLLMRGES